MTIKLPLKTTVVMLLLLSVSCEQESIAPERIDTAPLNGGYRLFQTVDDSEARVVVEKFFENERATTGRTLQTMEIGVDFSAGSAIELDSLNIYSFDIKTEETTVVENFVLSDDGDQIYNYRIRFEADSSWLASNNGFYDWSTFTGSVTQFSIEGDVISFNYLEGGQNIVEVAADSSGSGRVMADKCCWRTSFSTVTGQPMAILDCGSGDDLIVFGVSMGNGCITNTGGGIPVSPGGPTPSPFNPTPTGGGSGTTSPNSPVIVPGSTFVLGLYSPSTFLYNLNPNQTTFGKISYTSSTPSQRAAHTLNYIRYCKKANISVNLNNIFSNLPTNKVFDQFSTAMVLNGEKINLTRIELPLGNDFTTFSNTISRTSQVNLTTGLHRNIEFTVNCGGCQFPLRAFLVQVPESQFNTLYNFLRGL